MCPRYFVSELEQCFPSLCKLALRFTSSTRPPVHAGRKGERYQRSTVRREELANLAGAAARYRGFRAVDAAAQGTCGNGVTTTAESGMTAALTRFRHGCNGKDGTFEMSRTTFIATCFTPIACSAAKGCAYLSFSNEKQRRDILEEREP
ncbi:hypothetical protein MTO96_010494 [Rhipicephalus appendiculatus]